VRKIELNNKFGSYFLICNSIRNQKFLGIFCIWLKLFNYYF